MIHLSKLCDAADWFDSEFQEVIKSELKEFPRFHRKQWEFAIIFLALRRLGFLNEESIGLSMGGGNERVLYSIARYVKKLFVTDLYSDTTGWDCARTDDPIEFIRSSKPFEVDDSKIEALRMDMRDLQFEDNTFDFCYSSCAIEHIGNYPDFVEHFNEVNRCLKDGGVYVLTTEFQLGNETIKDPNNYIFSPNYLKEILGNIDLSIMKEPIVSLTEHEANLPLPVNVNKLFKTGSIENQKDNFPVYPHLLLLRGKYPFTSISFILKKDKKKEKNNPRFIGFENSRSFLEEGLKKYKKVLDNGELSLSPFSSLPDGVSFYYQDHSEFFTEKIDESIDKETLFHTDYFWLGSIDKSFNVSIKFNEQEIAEGTSIQLRVHRYATHDSQNVECVYEKDITIDGISGIEEEIILKIGEDFNYAIVGKVISGSCKMERILISYKPAIQFTREENSPILQEIESR
ncbi:MAG: class I SAM-dependent methyltransferase [Ignavibacteria bacterium]|nr:class I SAM-dependent methyltransferase [Ignavibacteria bacterium]